ncbi:extracellular solute-binding protein [Clostridium grantii]|uniref:Putative aldouronate transport system substrate-binding protein n=1 Tax=Clostridium grantii DSM 8605 TaxID=1121316 RepID=A0A1M5U1W3_9CLOT|nr:extracellular solute-binding protein [Clostridium grantii]SHH57075.1 putative aldouronate transport system substrate-binding protein [Clostridium grantii DSM 8605]
MKKSKLISGILSIFLSTTLLAGCGGNKSNEKVSNDPVDVNVTADTELKLPISEEKITLKVWMPFSSTIIQNLSENLAFQEMEKRTNIKIEFIHPAAGQENEQFNLMIASDELPDIIINAPTYPGGPDKAIDDGVYLRLNDYIDKYAPEYNAIRKTNKDIERQTISDSGNIWSFACVQLDKEPSWSGAFLRSDWLKELNLEMPTTIDEWHNVLTEFKNKKNVEAPLLLPVDWRWASNDTFVGAFGVSNSFFNENGTVKYGPIEPGYKDFLTTMNQWYSEGLLDKDFATRDNKSRDALFSSGKAGAGIEGYGAFGPYLASGKTSDPNFALAAAPMPSLNKGEDVHLRQTNPYVRDYYGVVTADSKYAEEAVKWLDYAYTEEGFLLYCYGVEGVSYNMVDGEPGIDKNFFPEGIKNSGKHPEFTDALTNDPTGLDFWDIYQKYKVHVGPFIRNPLSYGELSDEILNSMETWGASKDDYVMPPVTLSADENKAAAPIMSEVQTYQKEMMYKFIMGLEPISKFDEYVEQLKALGVEEAIGYKQNALERYNAR